MNNNTNSITSKGGTHKWRILRNRVLRRDAYSCTKCGASKHDGIKLEIDHIVRRKDGGTDDLDNLVTLCKQCHLTKTVQENRGDFFYSQASPLPIPCPFSPQKGTSKGILSDIVRIKGDDCFEV